MKMLKEESRIVVKERRAEEGPIKKEVDPIEGLIEEALLIKKEIRRKTKEKVEEEALLDVEKITTMTLTMTMTRMIILTVMMTILKTTIIFVIIVVVTKFLELPEAEAVGR